MNPLANHDSDYLHECLAAWRALDDRDATGDAIEAELRVRGVDLCEDHACQHLTPDELRLRMYARHGKMAP